MKKEGNNYINEEGRIVATELDVNNFFKNVEKFFEEEESEDDWELKPIY